MQHIPNRLKLKSEFSWDHNGIIDVYQHRISVFLDKHAYSMLGAYHQTFVPTLLTNQSQLPESFQLVQAELPGVQGILEINVQG